MKSPATCLALTIGGSSAFAGQTSATIAAITTDRRNPGDNARAAWVTPTLERPVDDKISRERRIVSVLIDGV
jgi:hypothetical protein